jgi:hypothetical protein
MVLVPFLILASIDFMDYFKRINGIVFFKIAARAGWFVVFGLYYIIELFTVNHTFSSIYKSDRKVSGSVLI